MYCSLACFSCSCSCCIINSTEFKNNTCLLKLVNLIILTSKILCNDCKIDQQHNTYKTRNKVPTYCVNVSNLQVWLEID